MDKSCEDNKSCETSASCKTSKSCKPCKKGLIILLIILFVVLLAARPVKKDFNDALSFFKSMFSSEEALLESNVFVKKISADSPFFVIWDTTNKEYQDMIKKHPVAFSRNTAEALAKSDASIKNYFEVIKRIFNTEKLDATYFSSKGVFFFEELKEGSFPLGMYVKISNKLDENEVYNAIKEFANENAFDYKEVKIDDNKVVSVTFRKQNAKEFNMNFLVNGSELAISNRDYLIKRYLTKDFDSKYVENLINNDEAFKRSYEKSLKDNTTSFGFAALVLNSNFLPDKKVQEELSKLPVKNVVMNQAFNNKDMLITRVASFYNPQTEEQKKFVGTFNSSNTVVAPSVLPHDTIISITANVNFIKGLISGFGVEDKVAPYAHQLNMEDLSVTLQGPVGSIALPSISIVAGNAQDSDKIIEDIKNVISSSKNSLPIPANTWQKKKVNDLDIEYLITPLGVGLFMGKWKDNLIIATSENLLSEIISVASKKTAKAVRTKYDTKNKAILNIYGSSKALANALRTLSDFLKAFVRIDFSYDEKIEILEQTPDSVINVFSEDDTIIGESKIVIE